MNPDRFQAFAEAYIIAVLQAATRIKVYLMSGESVEDYALQVSLIMLERIRAGNIEAVQGYYLNTCGGALGVTCEVLGIENSVRAVNNYLEGGGLEYQSWQKEQPKCPHHSTDGLREGVPHWLSATAGRMTRRFADAVANTELAETPHL